MNSYFNLINTIVWSHGGSVVKLACVQAGLLHALVALLTTDADGYVTPGEARLSS